MVVTYPKGLGRGLRFSLLAIFFALLTGCADKTALLSQLPPQPPLTKPYALLKFSAAMQLLALDEQAVDPATPISMLRVAPGRHALRFIHVNSGPEGSAEHAGQRADPFVIETFEGLIYEFEAKT